MPLFPNEEAETPRDEGICLRLQSQQEVGLGQGLRCAVPRSRTLCQCSHCSSLILVPPAPPTSLQDPHRRMEGRTHIYLLNTHLGNDISSPCCVPNTFLEIGHPLLEHSRQDLCSEGYKHVPGTHNHSEHSLGCGPHCSLWGRQHHFILEAAAKNNKDTCSRSLCAQVGLTPDLGFPQFTTGPLPPTATWGWTAQAFSQLDTHLPTLSFLCLCLSPQNLLFVTDRL